jgi:hypothetical protein
MSRAWLAIGICVLFTFGLNAAPPKNDDPIANIAKQEAKDVCLAPSDRGRGGAAGVAAQVDAGLPRLVARIAKVDIGARADISAQTYENVLRQDLPTDRADYRKCAQNIFIFLYTNIKRSAVSKHVAPPPPPTGLRPQVRSSVQDGSNAPSAGSHAVVSSSIDPLYFYNNKYAPQAGHDLIAHGTMTRGHSAVIAAWQMTKQKKTMLRVRLGLRQITG